MSVPDYMLGILAGDARVYAERLQGYAYAEYCMAPADFAKCKYYFAQHCWQRRNDIAPGRNAKGQQRTWRLVFGEKYGEPLSQYIERVRREQRQAA